MKSLFTLVTCALLVVNLWAADHLVEEFGLAPAYSTIGDAVAAATDGDRIIIKNRTGGIPWVENITVNKSLTFVSYDNDDFFVVQGNWTITPAAGREINIIGMRNTSGYIAGNGNGTGARTVVNILDSRLESGYISFFYNAFKINIAGCRLDNGYIGIRYGNIIGNEVSYNGSTPAVTVANDAAATSDVINIVGNRISNDYSSSSNGEAIEWSSSAHFFNIRNNFLESKVICLSITAVKNDNARINAIYNNSIKINSGNSSGYSFYGIYTSGLGASSVVEIMNNIVDLNSSYTSPSYRGIYSATSSGQTNVYYNAVDNVTYMDNPISGSFTVDVNNITNQPVTIGSTGIPSATVATDAGNPANPFYDIDLTPNNLGCYGGSYTQGNFFPLFSGAARVYWVDYPFNIRQGNTLSIDAESFDR